MSLNEIFSFPVIPFVVFVWCFWKVSEIIEIKWKTFLPVKFQIWAQQFYTKNEFFHYFFKDFVRIKVLSTCISKILAKIFPKKTFQLLVP